MASALEKMWVVKLSTLNTEASLFICNREQHRTRRLSFYWDLTHTVLVLNSHVASEIVRHD